MTGKAAQGPTIKEAIRMGIDKAAQGTSERAKEYEHGLPRTFKASSCLAGLYVPIDVQEAYDAGYAAAEERTCVWREAVVRGFPTKTTACGKTFKRYTHATMAETGSFCQFCGGKIKFKEGA